MFRLAHISDIHLGPLPKVRRRDLFSKRITGYVNFRRNRSSSNQPEITANLLEYLKALNPDHTVITGDLINIGLSEEIENARNWLAELGMPADNTVVLGNHDAYVRGAREKAMAAWQAWITGDNGRKIGSDKDYPVLRQRGDISIVGCNSARASAPFLATGYFSKAQARSLSEMLEEEAAKDRCRVVLIHHPPAKNATLRHKRLIRSARFRDAIRSSGAELVLHGHTHLATLDYIEGPNQPVPVVCVPAAYQWAGANKPPAGLNVINIAKSNSGWALELERHGLDPEENSQFRLLGKQDL